jgi:hypothetical protein
MKPLFEQKYCFGSLIKRAKNLEQGSQLKTP